MAPITPNPATNEWVPVWDLNGGSSGTGGGSHHTTHEIGGTDVIQGVAWLSQPNIFTNRQVITDSPTGSPTLVFRDNTQLANQKQFWIKGGGNTLVIQPIADADGIQATAFQMDRSGNVRLFSDLYVLGNQGNVACKDQLNTFTQDQVIKKTRPDLQLQYTGDLVKTHLMSENPTGTTLSNNLGFDGTNWLRDDVGRAGSLIEMNNGGINFFRAFGTGNPVILDRSMLIGNDGTVTIDGNLSIGGSIIAGTIPDARLSSNVALKNINNFFVAQQFASDSLITGVNSLLGWLDTSGVINTRFWRMLQYGDGQFWLEALNDAQDTYQARFGFYRNGEFVGYLDASLLNRGTVPDVRLTVNVLKYSGGYPGGTANFLRADGTFSPPSGGINQTVGTWFPTIGGIPAENGLPADAGESGQGYNIRYGYYVKTGRLVHLWIYTQFGTPKDNSGNYGTGFGKGTIVGDVGVKGFPFPVATVPGLFAGVNAYYTNMLTPSTKLSLTFYTGGTLTYGRIKQLYQDNNPLPLHDVDVNNTTQFVFSVSYFTDS